MDLEQALQAIADLENEKTELSAKLSKELADKADISTNFDKYRKKFTATDEEYTATKAERDTLQKEYGTYKTSTEERETKRRGDFMENKRKEMSKGDAKIAAALDAEYSILNLPDSTEAEIQARFEKARSIVQGSGIAPSITDASSGGSPAGDGQAQETPLSAAAQ